MVIGVMSNYQGKLFKYNNHQCIIIFMMFLIKNINYNVKVNQIKYQINYQINYQIKCKKKHQFNYKDNIKYKIHNKLIDKIIIKKMSNYFHLLKTIKHFRKSPIKINNI